MLDRFELLRDLGKGGTSEVWLARDTSRNTLLALKRLRRDGANGKTRLRLALFEREYHMLAQLRHPHIVQVEDYGLEEDGGAYYTMELLEGADLHDRRKLPWRELCAVVRDIGSALALLHSRRLVHRDLTPRNVRFTADGKPKLIDFGALAPMGVCREVIGTPPFVPPELLNGMALDGRSDLYSLGALMYYVLTGRHAYPARSLSELRDYYRTRPAELGALLPDLPPALSQLVMSLLSLDESARPRSAGEVIERVCAIAELPRAQDVDFGRAFLTAPKLIGRDEPAASVRRHVLQARMRRGTNLLVEGEPGVGRTRFLERCALEGKIAGAIVLQAFASDAGRGDYGVLQALTQDLLVAAPELALELAKPDAEWLAHALPELSRRLGLPPSGRALDGATLRQRVQQAVLDWLTQLGRRKHLVLLIDDLHHADEPSVAVLAALARRAPALALNVIASLPLDAGATLSPAAQLLSTYGARIKLRPLSRADFTAMLRSLFGDVPGMTALAEHLHQQCGGLPSACMAVAEHLIDADLVRYDRGSFVLPSSLEGVALPKNVRRSFERRIDGLDADARELCEALALADGLLPLASFSHLSSHGDPTRLHAALARLVASSVLVGNGDGYAFAHPGLASAVLARLEPDAARAAHARLYRAHEELSAPPMRLAYHALYGGDPARAARLVIEFWKERLDSDQAAELEWPAHMRETIEPLVAYCEREGFSPADVFVLRQVLVLATMWSDPAYALEQGRELDAILRRDVGLVYWDEVGDGTTHEKLTRCLQRAQAVYDAAPPEARGLPPLTALQRLGRHVLYGTQCASFANHADRMRELGELIAPLAELAPALGLIDLLARAALLTMRGLSDTGAAMLEEVLRRLDQPGVGLPDSHIRLFRLGVLYGLGLVCAKYLDPRVPQWAAELAGHVLHQPNAYRLRKVYHLHEPDLLAAAECQDRIEMHALQLNRGFWGNTAFIEAWTYAVYGDFQGVKQTLAVTESLAERFPSQEATRDFTRALHHMLSGDPRAAEPLFASAYEACVACEDYFRMSIIQDYRALALIALGEPARARADVLDMLARLPHDWLHRYRSEAVIALCEAELGEHERALARAAAAVEDVCRRRRMFGAHRIMTLECAARAALVLGDRARFEEYACEITTFCESGRCPSLRARHAALLKEARRRQLRFMDRRLLSAFDTLELDSPEETAQSVREAMDQCTGPIERAQRALSLLVKSSRAAGGFLYAVRPGPALGLLASSPGHVPQPAVVDAVRARLEVMAQTSEEQTELDVTPREEPTGLVRGDDGSHYQIVFLQGGDGGGLPSAAAVLCLESDDPRLVPYELVRAIGQALLEAGDVTAVT